VHPGDLAGGFSDLEMTWLLYCAGAAIVIIIIIIIISSRSSGSSSINVIYNGDNLSNGE